MSVPPVLVRLMSASEAGYAPSWVDRLIDRVEALPVPAWASYLSAAVLVGLIASLAVWIDGWVEFGRPDPYQLSLGFYIVIALGGIDYLDRAAGRAWRSFRPVLDVDDETAASFEYQLTTMPARTTLAWTLMGVVGHVIFFASETSIRWTPVTLIVNGVLELASICLAIVLGYHTLRQLRLIDQLHGRVQQVDLFHLMPLHAFSRVSSATGIVLLAMVYVSFLTSPASMTTVALVTGWGITVALSIACFVVPLYGMHTRIAMEKAHRLEETDRRLKGLLAELDQRSDLLDHTDADALNKHLASVVAERQVLSAVPTWPWQAETLRGFVTAIVLPVVLWLVYWFLQRQLG